MQATRSYDLGKQLVRKGHKVTIFASSFSHYKLQEERLKEGQEWLFERHDGVQFLWLKTTPYNRNDWRRAINMLSYSLRAWRVGTKLQEHPDVIIGTCVHPFAPLVAYALSKINRCRFFYEVTDLWPQTLVDMGALSENNPVTMILRLLEKFLFSKAECIISLLPNVNEYITRIGISDKRVVWIPNGVDLSNYSNVTPYNGVTSGIFKVMYVGGFSKYHVLDVVIDAAKILEDKGIDNIRFVFVGDGAEKVRIANRANELGLGNVEFRGLVPKSDLFNVLSEADALVYTFKKLSLLKYGVSPVKIFDYLASGRPILYAVDGGNNPVAEAKAGITIPPESPAALSDAIVQLINSDPNIRVEMGRRGMEFVKSNHSIEILADRLEAVLTAPFREADQG